jgi:hypothetical protein
LVVTFTFLHYQKAQLRRSIKHELMEGIDKEELVLIKVPTEARETLLQWEHAKEFEYRGEMYDVVRSEALGDTTYYWCWWDNEETALNQRLTELLSGAFDDDNQHQQQQKRLLHFLKSLYFSETQTTAYLTAQKDISMPVPNVFYNNPCYIPAVPPPDQC